MHLSILTPRGGGGGDSQGELDNFEKSLTNSPPTGIAKNCVQNPLDGLSNLEKKVSNFSSYVFNGVLSNSRGWDYSAV